MSNISSSVIPINPTVILDNGFELIDQNIIPSSVFKGQFNPQEDKIELFIYDFNKELLEPIYNFSNYSINNNTVISDEGDTDLLNLNPTQDITNIGFTRGNYYSVYNFVSYELNSTPDERYYIAEISSDRTEIRLKSNFVSKDDIKSSYPEFEEKISNPDYFDEFYIVKQDNQYFIGVNSMLEETEDDISVLIKLYEPLPSTVRVKDEIYFTTKVAETQAFEVKFLTDDLPFVTKKFIGGPNLNVKLKDTINNSTEYKTYEDLTNANTTGSIDRLQNILNRKGVYIEPNYSKDTFDEFIHFSSAKARLENFYYKVGQIQGWEDDITLINTITGSTSSSTETSASIAVLEAYIQDTIKNFDGYEYYLYYESGSSAYPKSNSTVPYTLFNTGSSEVLTWLGSDVESSGYYGGILYSASIYDNTNKDYLKYAIPEFIRENDDNLPYIDFVNMIGQHYDELWLYIKSITDRHNTTNQLDKGIPLQLANEAIKSLGFDEISNNYNNQDNFTGLLGFTSTGEFQPPTGSELINEYIAVNSGNVSSSWNPDYEFLDAFPYAIDDISKEIYKRLFHNMSYLIKKKGTISGLRQLINVWGVPNTILKINEFGGKNRVNTNDWDSWENRYSYAFKNVESASILIPWLSSSFSKKGVIQKDFSTDYFEKGPNTILFKFKTTGFPSSSAGIRTSQSLLLKKSEGDDSSGSFDFGVVLYYTGSGGSGSYSGSIQDNYKDYGNLVYYLRSDGTHYESTPIDLPFFNGDWWSVMLHTYQDSGDGGPTQLTGSWDIYVKNSIYNGGDGNKIGYQASQSIYIEGSARNTPQTYWDRIGETHYDGVYLGGHPSGAKFDTKIVTPPNQLFSGSFLEFRYYSSYLSESVFDDYVMNPESIEGMSVTSSGLISLNKKGGNSDNRYSDLSSYKSLFFRAPLGNELETKFETTTSGFHSQSYTSHHPAITGSNSTFTTSSFTSSLGEYSTYKVLYYSSSFTGAYSEPITTMAYRDQLASGIRSRVNNKITVVASGAYGNILSRDTSIEQHYQQDQDYNENINYLEVSFSPTDEIDNDIIQTYGFGVVQNVIGDLRQISSSGDYYPQLRKIAEDYFQKYTDTNVYDYIRLIKYFDNSLFKAIKNYVPARTSLSTGIVIKQHLLERNKINPPQLSVIYSQSQILYTASIDVTTQTSSIGSSGGSVLQYNYSGSASFGQINISQSWSNSFDTPVGLQTIIENSQKEFLNGEYSGSIIKATTQSLNPYQPFRTWNYQNTTGSEITYSSSIQFIYDGTDNLQWSASYHAAVGVQKIFPTSTNEPYEGTYSVYFSESKAFNTFRVSASTDYNPDAAPFVPYASGSLRFYLRIQTGSFPNGIQPRISTYDDVGTQLSVFDIGVYIDQNNSSSWQLVSVPIQDLYTGYEVLIGEEVYGMTIINFITESTYFYIDNIVMDSLDDTSILYFESFIPTTSYADYNPLVGNVNRYVENKFYQDIDYSYDYKTPVNFDAIRSSSALKATVPESNYTAKSSITSKYEGTRVSSLDYNNYTESGSVIPYNTIPTDKRVSSLKNYITKNRANLDQVDKVVASNFLNGDTGNWGGDNSYGKTSVVDSRPIYFAQFKEAYENYNIWDTYTYILDSLIYVPLDDISGIEGYEPITIQLSPNKTNIIPVSSTFKSDRKINVNFDSLVFNGIKFKDLTLQKSNILQGALDYRTLNTNQTTRFEINPSWSYDRFENTYTASISTPNPEKDTIVQLQTGSNDGNKTGYLFLSGSEVKPSDGKITFYNEFSYQAGGGSRSTEGCLLGGPQLAVIHTYNQYLYNRMTNPAGAYYDAAGNKLTPSYPVGPPYYGFLYADNEIDPTDPRNYFQFNPSNSYCPGFEDPNTPFLIFPGDEIRVTYVASGSTSGIAQYNQDFTVLGYAYSNAASGSFPHSPNSNFNNYLIESNGTDFANDYGRGSTGIGNPNGAFDTLVVTPNPSDLDVPIPQGKIYRFTIRRRNDVSNRLLISSLPVSGSKGALTKSGGGYLIPDDLSETQKENVKTIINQLKSKNSFRNDDR